METDRSEKILSLQLEWVRTADSKVTPLFAINIAMLGFLAALIKSLPAWTISPAIFSSITVILLVVSMLFLALTMFPRLIGPKDSSISFGGISKQSEDKYLSEMSSMTDDEFQKDILRQVYRNAEIANSKYANLRLAFIFTFVSIIPWLGSVYALYV